MTTPTTYANAEAAIRDGLDSAVAYAGHRPNIDAGTGDREMLVRILVEALSRVAKPQPAAVGDGDWRAHFCRLAKVLGCLPSSFPECNEHVLAKAARLMSAAPAPSAPQQHAAVGDAHPLNYHYGPEPAADPMAIVGRFCWEKRANGNILSDQFGNLDRLDEFLPKRLACSHEWIRCQQHPENESCMHCFSTRRYQPPSLEIRPEDIAKAMQDRGPMYRDFATPAPSAPAQAAKRTIVAPSETWLLAHANDGDPGDRPSPSSPERAHSAAIRVIGQLLAEHGKYQYKDGGNYHTCQCAVCKEARAMIANQPTEAPPPALELLRELAQAADDVLDIHGDPASLAREAEVRKRARTFLAAHPTEASK